MRLHKDTIDRLVKEGRLVLPKTTIPKRLKDVMAIDVVDINYPIKPSDDHHTYLYRLLVKEYGRFLNGGLVAWELSGVIKDSKYRLDIAFPNYKLGIESDGWQYHGKFLKDFKKDRKKWIAFTSQGWRIIPVTLEMVRDDVDQTLSLIRQTLQWCDYQVAEAEFNYRTFLTKLKN